MNDWITQFIANPNLKLIVSFLLGIMYTLFHFRCVVVAAKKRASIAILAAEKNADTLLLTNEKLKMDWIREKGYSRLPALLKLFVSKITFNAIILDVYKTALDFVEMHQPELPPGAASPEPPSEYKIPPAVVNLPEARWPRVQSN